MADTASITARETNTAPPPRAFERRLVIWSVLLVTFTAGVCVTWLNHATRHAMQDNHARNVAVVAQTLANTLAGRVNAVGADGPVAILRGLTLDERMSFVQLLDEHGRPIYKRVIDPTAWRAYERFSLDAAAGPATLDLDRPINLADGDDLVAWKVPIWEDRTSSDLSRPRKLDGFLVVGMRDRTMEPTLASLRSTYLLTACAVCLACIPAAVFLARRFTRPLRILLDATIRLGAGQEPPPVIVAGRDEVALLARNFNLMARNLSSTRTQLENAKADLEEKVVQRTAELERLNRQLENEVRERNEFLRAVSHDLGAPLRNISGMTGMLLAKYRGALADDALTKLERIAANAQAQTDLINDLLELSRLRTRPGRRELIDMNAQLTQIRESLAFDLERARITLEIAPDMPALLAEPNRMRQVFQNLLDNAVKYMLDAAERRIRISWREVGEELVFTVADTGRGIAAADLPNLFQVFRRAVHSGGQQVPGRGVGLASVKSIVEGYGGRIWAESTLGKGSTFHIAFDRRTITPPLETATTEA